MLAELLGGGGRVGPLGPPREAGGVVRVVVEGPGVRPDAALVRAGFALRGDEARVLSALLVLRSTRANDPAPADQYRKIKEWGFDARAALSSPIERYEEGLVEVWERTRE